MGVWIETPASMVKVDVSTVTPCVGVWIETNLAMINKADNFVSHPAWVCGLKPQNGCCAGKELCVTPCVGVWIETCTGAHGPGTAP